MIPAFGVSCSFKEPAPSGFFEDEDGKDSYELFTSILLGVGLTGTIITFLLSAFSLVVVLKQNSGAFACVCVFT